MSLAGRMTPVRPRKQVPNITGQQELDLLFKDNTAPFALWMIDRPLTSLPKVDVNNGIVVVGASRTGLAFLEALLMGPASRYLNFTNMTLVSEHGLPTAAECLKAADTCIPRDGRYTDRYLKSIPFYYYLDVMSAVLVKIDRQRKCIHLKGGSVKYYDTLVLTCGQQFQHPDYMKDALELFKEIEKGKPWDHKPMDDPNYQPDRVQLPPDLPENVMLINSIYEANISFRKLLRMITDCKEGPHRLCPENRVVVYGACLEAYSCLAALLELGLAADLVAFVEPFPPEDHTMRVNCFNNETVDHRVQMSLENLGIRVFRHSRLTGWQARQSRVHTVRLVSRLHAFKLPAFALFYYGHKAIDVHAFKAINECGLVYDGGLVVGPQFETNDPFVFGAGSCTRYSRRLYADRYLQQYYSSEDVGEALANMFLERLDPFVSDINKRNDLFPQYSSTLSGFLGSHKSIPNMPNLSSASVTKAARRNWQPVLKFDSPLFVWTTMPGPLYYMKLRRPGQEIPMEVALSLPNQGHTLLTDKNGNYFRLQLNVLHCVEGASCLSKKPFHPEILVHLYGKHESFFNKLLYRYKTNQIDDLYTYFSQAWMSALYQDTFESLLADINEQGIETESKSLETLRSVIDRFVDMEQECGQNAVVRDEGAAFWKAIGGDRVVMSYLCRYLHRYAVSNPHYAKPDPDLS